MAKRGLGKGLGAIFGEDVVSETKDESQKQIEEQKETENNETYIKISRIEQNKEQPRKKFNEEQLNELAESIKTYGLIQPILVQKKGNFYEIITGERRWRAAKIAGLKEIPVIIKEYSKRETLEIALIENLQREDLNAIEEAKAYQSLIKEYNLTQEEIAERVGKNRTTITNSVRLLKLDEQIQDMLIQGLITGGHARALLSLENTEDQIKIAARIVKESLSVRETERLVKRIIKKSEEGNKEDDKEKDEGLKVIYQALEERMKTVMGTKVSIHKRDKNKGKVEIEYYSEDELERIVDMIESIKKN